MVDGRPARHRCVVALAIAWACAAIAGCGEESPEPEPERSAPSRPNAPACELGEATTYPGSSPALAAGGVVVRHEGVYRLLVTGAEPRTLDARWISPRGLARHGDGWLALASTDEGPALLTVGPAEIGRISLGSGTLVDGALALSDERAVATWIDDTRALRVARIDPARATAEPTVVLDDMVRRRPVIATTAGGTFVSAPGAPLYRVGEPSAERRRAPPGLVVGLAEAGRELAVLHRAPDRTGLWLSIGDAPAVRASGEATRAASPSLAPLPNGLLLVYRAGTDIVLQRLHADGEPSGSPQIVGAAGERASAPLAATDGERVWIAWETTDEDGPAVRVRSGTCPAAR